jgi:hypothetical protein
MPAIDELTRLKADRFRTGVGTAIEDYKKLGDQLVLDLLAHKNRLRSLYEAFDPSLYDTDTATRIKAQLVSNAQLVNGALGLLAAQPTVVDVAKAAAENPETFTDFPL